MIPYLETHICDHCNLKCKGCSHFSGLAPEQFKDINEFDNEMNCLHLITQIKTIRLMGGEPLLNSNVVNYCTITRKYFPSSEIVLVSNGILLSTLSDEQINILNQNKIALCMSNYGLKLNQEQINKFNTHYFHNKNMMYNISLDLSGSQDNVTSFINCDLVHGGWYFLKDGRIYQCCIMANINFFEEHFNKKLNIDLDDISIDIFNHTEQQILNFLQTPHQACRYCNTIKRHYSYSNFSTSSGDINEWIAN